jgi:RNA polymerase sigma factor (sigma-70 family)
MSVTALEQTDRESAFSPDRAPDRPRHLWSVPSDDAGAQRRENRPADINAATAAWQRLLGFLAKGQENDGMAYERMRTRLIRFFRARGVPNAEELADATFDRLLHKLTDEDVAAVRHPIAYALRFASFHYLEWGRGELSRRHRLKAIDVERPLDERDAALEEREHDNRLALVERCLAEMNPADRALLIAYYQHDGSERIASRRELSRAQGLSPAMLRTRVSRLRAALQRRVRACARPRQS